MKAITVRSYGTPDVMRLEEVPVPEVDADQVLVRVKASSVNPYDWHFLTGLPQIARLSFGMRRPRNPILGADFAGVIEQVGDAVEGWSVGDAVFGQKSGGCYAEYIRIPQKWLVAKPDGVTFEQAAAAPLAGATALQAVRDHLQVGPGTRLLVNGASGGVGTFAVQFATGLGAEVTAVCSSRNVEMVRGLGATHVVDYTREDFTKSADRYDAVLDLIGNHPPRMMKRVLAPDGTYLASHGRPDNRWLGPVGWLIRMKLVSMFGSKTMTSFTAKAKPEDWRRIGEMLESDEITVPIDRTYPLAEVPDAFRYAEQWHTRGKVVITV